MSSAIDSEALADIKRRIQELITPRDRAALPPWLVANFDSQGHQRAKGYVEAPGREKNKPGP
jgi:hypothetical protein